MADLIVTLFKYAFGFGIAASVSKDFTNVESFFTMMNGTNAEFGSAITAYFDFMKTIGYGILLLYFLIHLTDRVAAENFTAESFIKDLLKLIVCVLFINYAKDIMINLFRIANNATKVFGSTSGTSVDSFIDGIQAKVDDASIWDKIVYLVAALLPGVVGLGCAIVVKVLAYSRIVELLIRFLFSPIAFASILTGGLNSSGVKYMKKFLAVAMQGIVIILVFNFGQAAIGLNLKSLNIDSIGSIFTSILAPLAGTVACTTIALKAQPLLSEALGA